MHTYRIVQGGLPLLLPHVTRQLLHLTVAEMLHLVEDRSVSVPEEACIAYSKPAQADGEQQVLSIKPNSPVLCSLLLNDLSVFARDAWKLCASKPISWVAICCTEVVLVYKIKLRTRADAGEEERLVAEKQKHAQRYSLEDPRTVEQIRNLSRGCCVVMPRYMMVLLASLSVCSKCRLPLVLVLH